MTFLWYMQELLEVSNYKVKIYIHTIDIIICMNGDLTFCCSSSTLS